MQLNLIIGVNVLFDVLFKKERRAARNDGNMCARVGLFDDSGNLVAEWMSNEGALRDRQRIRTGSGRNNSVSVRQPGRSERRWLRIFTQLAERSIPRTTQHLQLLARRVVASIAHPVMAGLPQVPAAGQNDGFDVNFLPRHPISWTPSSHQGCDFEFDCYNNPGVD